MVNIVYTKQLGLKVEFQSLSLRFKVLAGNQTFGKIAGDNLFPHFSPEVFRLCEGRNIKVICLLPNTTNETLSLSAA